ncbi:14232_t:CDS:2, partial [Racocetra persica]
EQVFKKTMEDTVPSKFTSSPPVEFETANESIKLVTIKADEATESLEEMEPGNEQNFQLLVGSSYTSWDIAETHLNNYAKAVGFTLRRKRVVTDSNGK